MAPQKETLMVLKVDLDCHRCYTKVKRLLCCYPQIMDQIYNEKQNTVTIKVVCCTPEKIRDKLVSRGGKSIKGIQILEPPKKPAADKPKDGGAPPAADKPPKQAAPAEKPPKEAAPADKPKDAAAPKPADEKPPEKIKKNGSKNGSKPQGDAPPAAKPKAAEPAAPTPAAEPKPTGQDAEPKPTGKAAEPKPTGQAAEPKPTGQAAEPKPTEQAAAAMVHMMPPELVQCYPGYPINAGCMECYDGRMCYHGINGYGYGAPPPPPPSGGWGYYGGGAAPGGYGYGGYKPVNNRYGDYVSDENPTGCVVM